ncbi:MAG: sporulation protein YqfC [Bacillota bacterium]
MSERTSQRKAIPGKEIRHKVADLLEMPREVVMDLPKVTLVGNMQVLLENHRGIIEYSPERLRISVSLGEIIITGQGLVLRNILPDQIVAEGKVFSVSYAE